AVAGRQASLVKELLPLLHHAVAEVVEDDDLDGQIVGGDRLELADVHADARIAIDIYDEPLGVGDLRADRGRQTKAHGSHAAGGEPAPRVAEVAILSGPHLVLSDAGADDGFAAGVPVDLFDDVVRLNELARAVVVHRVHALQLGELRLPHAVVGLEFLAAAILGDGLKRLGEQADVA